MPVSVNPSWSGLVGKPSTIAGFGITDHSWANLLSKPTTIAGFGITDAMLKDNGHGNIGSFAFAYYDTTANVVAGSTYSGASLKASGCRVDVADFAQGGGPNVSGAPLSGTWRALGTANYAGNTRAAVLFQRIA